MKFKTIAFIIGAASILLIIANGILYSQNISYKSKNRDLILQNDSLISVNIELKQQLIKSDAGQQIKKNKVAYNSK
jgi:hypothetical protein